MVSIGLLWPTTPAVANHADPDLAPSTLAAVAAITGSPIAAVALDSAGTAIGPVVDPVVAPTTVWPVAGPVTSEFGLRWGRAHNGMDFGVPIGTDVVAVRSGTVTEVGWQGGYGQTVVIDHGDGLITLSAHLSVSEVEVGSQVGAGERIARSGNTGRSTGPHLHFETKLDGVPVDPRGALPPPV